MLIVCNFIFLFFYFLIFINQLFLYLNIFIYYLKEIFYYKRIYKFIILNYVFFLDKGKVFGWGNTEYGQIPMHKDNQQVNVATELKICDDLGYIVDIASGGSFCMVLNSKLFQL
jgi:hypothetical protein